MKSFRKVGSVTLLVLCLALCVNSAYSSQDNPRMLLVGDSWAMFLSAFRSFPQAFAERGRENPGVVSMYWPGSEARDWNAFFPKFLLGWTLRTRPAIEVAVVSLGGNDLLGDYNTSLTADERQRLYKRIQSDLEGVILFMLDQKPSLRITLCGYDYPNFVESVSNPFFDTYRQQWREAGRPTPEEANEALIGLARAQQEIADKYDRVDFVNNFGLMQWAYGYPAVGLPPQTVPFPAERVAADLPPGGDPRLPSPPQGMLTLGPFVDAIHLNPLGYRLLAGNLIDRSLGNLLFPDSVEEKLPSSTLPISSRLTRAPLLVRLAR